jgi:hypothetical protein
MLLYPQFSIKDGVVTGALIGKLIDKTSNKRALCLPFALKFIYVLMFKHL